MFNDVFKIKDRNCRTMAFEILYVIKRKEGDFKNFLTSFYGLFEHSSLHPDDIKETFYKLTNSGVFTVTHQNPPSKFILKVNDSKRWTLPTAELDEQNLAVIRKFYSAKRPTSI